ncbi:MAG: fatty-acyl-CoA synthase [Gaiellaceae bacterium]|nr:fatty-acyl-CoA synthase [Gaiellaceae bacterium]
MSGRLTLGRWLTDRERTTPDRVAIDYHDREIDYRELGDAATRFASSFAERGLHRGDRVATLTGNTPEHVAIFFACARLGLILAPLSWRLTAPELAYQLEDSDPALFLVEPEHADLAAATSWPFEPLAVPTTSNSLLLDSAQDDDPLLLVYTSGTTGKPKGALLTHANCFWTNVGFDVATGISGDDVVLQVLPQFHCGGWNVQALLSWWKGARVVLERTFEPDRCLELIESKRVTTTMGVPANYLFMSQSPRFATADLSSLRRAVVGGAAMPVALLEVWRERGVEIVQGYGLTEAAPNVLCLPPEDAVRKAGYAGKPYPQVEVALSEENELLVRGPNVFAGYWRNPEATEETMVDGWLRTGDLAERDDEGYYRISGRLKEMYISGGENVYPAEVEDALLSLDGVADAAVLGVPDDRWGEVGVAFVVLEPGATLTADDIVEACRTRLARFKVPASVRFLDELPRSGMNKVLKDELRAAVPA